MDGEKLKEGLEGLSKMDNITDFLYMAIYWIAVIFIMVFIAYICSSVNCHMKRKKKGTHADNDDFLDD